MAFPSRKRIRSVTRQASNPRQKSFSKLGQGLVLLCLASACHPCPVASANRAHVPTASAPPSPPKALGTAVPLTQLRARIEALLEETMNFWLLHGYDETTGGFHGSLDRFGRPDVASERGLVQQTRHLFSLSLYARLRPNLPITRRQLVQQRADSLYAYIVKTFRDPSDGEFFFRADRTGQITDKNKPLYGQSFAIYALAEYALAFGAEEAKRFALEGFEAIERRTYDAKNQGYDQSATSRWLWSGATKDTNTHIHLLESFTHLYRATQAPRVGARARELVFVVLDKLVQPGNYTHAEFATDFTPFGNAYVSYGHDLETAWLLFESFDVLGMSQERGLCDRAWALGEHASTWGFDQKNGGYFEEGPVDGPPNKLEKIWWVQAEALAGLFRLYAYRPEPLLRIRLERTLDWIERFQRDPNEGEWYWGVLPDGKLGAHLDRKSEEWKSSYHVVRALLFTSDWLTRYLSSHPAQ